MNLTIIGTGFVGVVSSAVFASLGHTVFGLDIDQSKVEKLNLGIMPFYEPDLEELVKNTIAKGNLKFTSAYEETIKNSDVIFIAVGTPSAPDGQADLTFVFAAAKSLAPYLKDGAIVAIKSTVPPGTCDKVSAIIREVKPVENFFVVSLPEFLREGSAVEDTFHPDRIIIGATDQKAIDILLDLHKSFAAPYVVMKPESAQMCKYASNSYLATRITFINQIANLCEVNGADVKEVIKGIGMDKRIGSHYWYPGLGYGGSCFPKDVKELAAYAKAVGQPDNLMVILSELNEQRIGKLMDRFAREAGGWQGKTIAVLGLSFKPNTNDMREAPSTKIVPLLISAGAIVRAYDPMANEAANQYFEGKIPAGGQFKIVKSWEEAVQGADGIMVVVEWPQLINTPPTDYASKAKPGTLFMDCRDQFEKLAVEAAGMKYLGIGI